MVLINCILVNPLTSKDFYVTTFYRIIEKIIFNKLSNKELFFKGKYYE